VQSEGLLFFHVTNRFLFLLTGMAGKGYVPPQYIPLYGVDTEDDHVPAVEENHAARHKLNRDLTQWSSGICACFDDPQSCMPLSDLWCYLVA
jgi:hypothetical protein